MTTEARILFDTIAGWLLWITYFGGLGGTWAWLVYVVRSSKA